MNSWRNRLFAAGLVFLSATSVAGAQTESPAAPTTVDQATGAPRTLPGMAGQPVVSSPAASPQGATQIPAQPGILGRPGAAGVSVSSLGEVEGPPTGTLVPAEGGLGMNLWSGSGRTTVEELMSRLPLATQIGSVRALARRIVLTKAATPTGEADHAFMTVRITRLLDAGLLQDAAALASMAQIENDPGFARVQADAVLFAGASAHVCDNTTARRLDSADPFWIELRAYCYAVAGDTDALTLTRAVMNAQNINDDAFDTLLDDVQNNVAKSPGSIDAPTSLDAFLLRQVGLPVDYDTGSQLGTPGLLLVARSKDNPPADRLKAAEQILRKGALGPQELIDIADAQSFTRDQFATEHAQIRKLSFLAGQALLRQAVGHAAPEARPALIYEALSHARSKGLLGVAAVLQQAALTKLAPEPELDKMAPLFASALVMTGHSDEAAQWMALLNPQSVSEKPVVARFHAVLNLAAPTPSRQMIAASALDVLSQELTNKTGDEGSAALTLGLYAALGKPMSPAAQAAAKTAMQTRWPGRRPATSTLRRLGLAIEAPGRRGEALMLVLDAIGAQGPGDLAPDATAKLVRDLVKLGVPAAAHDIAVTALLRYRPAPPSIPNATAAAPPAKMPAPQ